MSYKTGGGAGGTGHFGRHLTSVHHLQKGCDLGGGGGTQSTIDPKTGQTFVFNPETYRLESMKMVTGMALPFNHCDGWRFTHWIQGSVNPLALRIPRTTMRSIAFKYFRNCQDLITATINSLPWKVNLTSDIGSFREFDILCVTCHWVDNDWMLQRRIIYFRSIAKHNSAQIVEGLVACCTDYRALHRISSISLDNASANDVAAKLLINEFKPEFEKLFHTRCLCHILNLVCKDGINVVWDEYIEPIRRAVQLVVNAGPRRGLYKQMVKNSGKPFKKLKLDCETRWNSTYDMLVRAYYYKDEITEFYNAYKPNNEHYRLLDDNKWNICYHLIHFLAPFKEYTLMFSSQYSPNIHLALECVVNLAMHLDANRYKAVCIDMIPNMEEKFCKYFDPIPYTYSIGAILCPTIKMENFRNFVDLFYAALAPHNDMNVKDTKVYCKKIEDYIFDMYAKYVAKHAPSSRNLPMHNMPSIMSSKITSRHNHLAKAMRAKITTSSTSTQDLNELTQYLKTPFDLSNYDYDNPIDLLAWWKSKQHAFPILTYMVKEIISIPMSTIASESAFSQARLQYTVRRQRLTSYAIEVCVCIKDWTAADHRKQDSEAWIEEHQKDMFDNISDIEEELEADISEVTQNEDYGVSEDELPEEDFM